jgi:hypothetical protein
VGESGSASAPESAAVEGADAGIKRKASISDDNPTTEERKKVKLEGGVMDGKAVAEQTGEPAAVQGGIEAQAAIDAGASSIVPTSESMSAVASTGENAGAEAETSIAPVDAATDTPTGPPAETSAESAAAPPFTFDSDMLKNTLAGLQGLTAPVTAQAQASGQGSATAGSGTGSSGIPGFSL